MKEFLSQKGVAFQEFNVAEDDAAREEMYHRTGRLAVPTVVVNGETIVGFDRNRLEKILQ